MTQQKYSAIIGAVAVLLMLVSIKLYYVSLAWDTVNFIITGVLAALSVCFVAFGIIKLLTADNKLFLLIGICIVSCITLLTWIFYWVDCVRLFSRVGVDYLENHYFDYNYESNCISGIIIALCPPIFFFSGSKTIKEVSLDGASYFDLFSGIFLCSVLIVASIEMFLYYLSIAVIAGLLLFYLFAMQKYKFIMRVTVSVVGIACVVFFIVEMALWGYEINFVLLSGSLYAILYAIIVFTSVGQRLSDGAAHAHISDNKVKLNEDSIKMLEDLKKLKDAGVLTEEEFTTLKKKILGE